MRRAFTLLELLVVIAIIAILAAILFPVLSRAQEQSRKIECASNMRQLGLSMLMYASEYDQTLPPYSLGAGYQGMTGYGGADGPRWADMIYPYVKNLQIYVCPSAPAPVTLYPGGVYMNVATYSYGINTPDTATTPFGAAARPLDAFADPASTIMLSEDGRLDPEGDIESLGLETVMATDTPEELSYRVNALRHTGVAATDYQDQALNLAYVDGHVKWMNLLATYPNQWEAWTD
jgi:prepilin-type N-terminal cleavage/methylation domain-containing protein/prepilin-type processing-associated H-X9-DG protein